MKDGGGGIKSCLLLCFSYFLSLFLNPQLLFVFKVYCFIYLFIGWVRRRGKKQGKDKGLTIKDNIQG